MLLAIDVGNTNIVFGIFQNDKLMGTFRLMTSQQRTVDEMGLMILQYFHASKLSPDQLEAILIASVVPPVMETLTRALERYLGKTPLIVDEDIVPSIKYEVEGRLGADRSVACEAAMEKYGMPLIVIDLGTATTTDAISETGVYMGGTIQAGLNITTAALSQKAAKLPSIELKKPNTVLGLNTVEQMQSGCMYAYLGGVDYLLRQTKKEMGYGDGVKVVATGGLAPIIAEHTNMIDIVDHQLILDGLRILYEKYQKQ